MVPPRPHGTGPLPWISGVGGRCVKEPVGGLDAIRGQRGAAR